MIFIPAHELLGSERAIDVKRSPVIRHCLMAYTPLLKPTVAIKPVTVATS
jgi:hypothetical protein